MSKELEQILIETGLASLNNGSAAVDVPVPEIATELNLLNARGIKKAEEAGRLIVAKDSQTGRQWVSSIVPEGAKGSVKPKKETVFEQVGPIFEQIRNEGGQRKAGKSKQLNEERQRITSSGSLANQALEAAKLINKRREHNLAAVEDNKQHQEAQEVLEDLLRQKLNSKREQKRLNSSNPGLFRRLGDGLTKGAIAALVGQPRASVETVDIDFTKGQVNIQTPAREVNISNIPVKQIVNGTVVAGVSVDLLSQAFNSLRRVFRRKPISLLGKGAVVFSSVLTGEVRAGTIEPDPFTYLEEMEQAIGALRVLDRKPLRVKEVPTFADLGLSGPELETQSGVKEQYVLPKKERAGRQIESGLNREPGQRSLLSRVADSLKEE